MKTTAAAQPFYCTISDGEGLPHTGNVETWHGTDYTVTSVTALAHGDLCLCGGSLVAYWPSAGLPDRTESQKQEESAKLGLAARECDWTLELTYSRP